MTVLAPTATTLRGRLRRPPGISESTRWLFTVLTVVSLVLTLPASLASARGGVLLMSVAAALTLTASWMYGYLTKHVPFGLDVLDSLAITALALSSPDPVMFFPVVFGAIWFRALYGSIWQSLTRCVLYGAALSATLPLWTLIPGHSVAPPPERLFGSFPVMFLTVVVGRSLASGLRAREQTLRRDAAVATMGAKLLGLTDATLIQDIAWISAAEIGAATPGLRLLTAVRDGEVLRVVAAIGAFRTSLTTLPVGVVTTIAHDGAGVVDRASLDAAVGTRIEWSRIEYGTSPPTWMLVGAPERGYREAFLAVQSLVNQVALALRNSDAHHELTAQATVDSLTGLANRASFTAKLARLTARRTAFATALHVLFLDLDDFKDVNDVLGHRAGDDVLIEVAVRLRQSTRPHDVCARLGGDEFAVVLRGATDAAAEEVGRRMVAAVAEPIHLSGRTARVGASIGIAAGTDGADMEDLVHQADVAMYAAKAHGKGRVQFFSSELLRADKSRLSLERQLAAATGAGELVVHYQPILSLPQLRCTAVEALVRWQHPERGLLKPADFIDAAERTGAIIDIGAFVLRRACADAARWHDAHHAAPPAVHINVSARQLDHDQFIETVLQCLAESQLSAGQLVLELTETVALNSPAAIDRLKALDAKGVRIAIDDFGTGYSSLSTVRSLPVNVVKLDRTFIAGALASRVDRTVLESIVQMARQLGMRTIAEGVERPAQQQFLEQIGTDEVQGYLYSRPVPASEFVAWLNKNLHPELVTAGNVVGLRSPRRSA